MSAGTDHVAAQRAGIEAGHWNFRQSPGHPAYWVETPIGIVGVLANHRASVRWDANEGTGMPDSLRHLVATVRGRTYEVSACGFLEPAGDGYWRASGEHVKVSRRQSFGGDDVPPTVRAAVLEAVYPAVLAWCETDEGRAAIEAADDRWARIQLAEVARAEDEARLMVDHVADARARLIAGERSLVALRCPSSYQLKELRETGRCR